MVTTGLLATVNVRILMRAASHLSHRNAANHHNDHFQTALTAASSSLLKNLAFFLQKVLSVQGTEGFERQDFLPQ